MKAAIRKLELKKIMNRHYIKIELADEKGIPRMVNNSVLSDDIHFRKLVFGILSACNCYDLMRLATSNPNCKKMVGYYQHGLRILENDHKECLTFDEKNCEYTCKKMNRKTRELIDMVVEYKEFHCDKEEGIIECITSQSGTFQLLFTCKAGSTFFTTGQIYTGFGYPLSTRTPVHPDNEAKSARMFTSFIVSLMKLYGVQDLLQFGGVIDQLPEVEISIHNHKITTITNATTGMGLSIGADYEIINMFELEKQKNKSLCKNRNIFN